MSSPWDPLHGIFISGGILTDRWGIPPPSVRAVNQLLCGVERWGLSQHGPVMACCTGLHSHHSGGNQAGIQTRASQGTEWLQEEGGGKRKHADSSVRHYRLKSIYQKKMFSVIADVGTSRAFYFFLILYVKDGVWKAKPLQKWLKTAVFLMASRWRLLLTPLDSSCLKVVL